MAVRYDEELSETESIEKKKELLTELNVGQSVENVCFSSTVQNAWARGQQLTVHGWVYSVKNGLLKDLIQPPISSIQQVHQLFHLNRCAVTPTTRTAENQITMNKHTHTTTASADATASIEKKQ